MSAPITRRERARRDLIDHFLYIARDNAAAAERLLDAVERQLEQLLVLPGMGALREYGNPRLAGMRMCPVPGFRRYLIFYRPTQDGIELIRVLHAARDLPNMFRDEE